MSSFQSHLHAFVHNITTVVYPQAKDQYQRIRNTLRTRLQNDGKFRRTTIITVVIGICLIGAFSFGSSTKSSMTPVFEKETARKAGTAWEGIDFGMSQAKVAGILSKDDMVLNEEFSSEEYKTFGLRSQTGFFVFKNDNLVYTKKFIPYTGEPGPILAPYMKVYGNFDNSTDLKVTLLSKTPYANMFQKNYSNLVHMNFQDADVMIELSIIQTNQQNLKRIIISHWDVNEFKEQVNRYISEVGLPIVNWLEGVIGNINDDRTYTQTPGDFKGKGLSYSPFVFQQEAPNYIQDKDGNLIRTNKDPDPDISVWKYQEKDLATDDDLSIIYFERSENSNYGMTAGEIKRIEIDAGSLSNQYLPKYTRVTHLDWLFAMINSVLLSENLLSEKFPKFTKSVNEESYSEKVGMGINLDKCVPYATFVLDNGYRIMVLPTGEIFIK